MQDFDRQTNTLSEEVIGAAIEVHRQLGPGFAEITYSKALAIELGLCGLSFSQEVPVSLLYKGHSIGEGRIDFVIERTLVVELKATKGNTEDFRSQVLAYLKAAGLPLGLIINFHHHKLTDGLIRVVNT